MSAPQIEPASEPPDPQLTVDELAARVGVTVRNVRAYSARGLLPPPRMVGRTGYYGREHVARLLLVREMLAEGYSLAMIERTLASAPPTAPLTAWKSPMPIPIPSGQGAGWVRPHDVGALPSGRRRQP